MSTHSVDLAVSIEIAAPQERVWDSLTRHMGSWFENPDPANPLRLTLEPWVGGRWFRDLSETHGEGAGHLWGHVQVLKPPHLLELCGPGAVSDAHAAHFAIRLTEHAGGTRVTVTHRAIGPVPEELQARAGSGWAMQLEGLKRHAER